MSYSCSVSLLATELYSTHGGVQAYMRRLAEILSEYNASRGGGLDCVSLLDSEPVCSRHSGAVAYRTFEGSRGSKARFTGQALQAGYRKRPCLMVVGHTGLTPVAWLLKRGHLTRSYLVVLHGVEAWLKLGWADRIACRQAASIVSTTRFTADEFCRYNDISRDKIRIIPLAIADSLVEDNAGIGHSSAVGQLRVLTVSRLSTFDSYKGVDMLIDAVADARARNVDIQLKIVGSGDEAPILQRRAAERNLNGSVVFTGSVSDQQLSDLYRECDIFALPSKGEGFGIVFLEAMRYGKPCIGGNHGGTPEVIEPGVTGFLVDYGDVATLTQRLIHLAADPAARLSMGANAQKVLRSRYLFPRMQTDWFSVLDEQAGNDHCMATVTSMDPRSA
jgi:phosphatidylinositol alpha-1,6-mannosyltransferase